MGLNYLNYQLADVIKVKPHIEVFQYMVLNDYSTWLTQHYPVKIKDHDLPFLNDLSELLNVQRNLPVASYLRLDKIFLDAYGSDTKELSYSNFWRYCESLFTGEKSAKQIQETIIEYYVKKSEHHSFISAVQMITHFNNNIIHSNRTKILGYERYAYQQLMHNCDSAEKVFKTFKDIIKNPIISHHCNRISELKKDKIKAIHTKHYSEILKSAYIQRNLFQHSNIVIKEFQELWYDRLTYLMGSLRNHIIKDLSIKLSIEKVEEVF